jgi:hypothetical protein
VCSLASSMKASRISIETYEYKWEEMLINLVVDSLALWVAFIVKTYGWVVN